MDPFILITECEDWLELFMMTVRDHRVRWTPVSGPYIVLFLSFGKLRWFLMVSNYVITITYCPHSNKIFTSCFQRWKIRALRASSAIPHQSQIWLNSHWVEEENRLDCSISFSLSLIISDYWRYAYKTSKLRPSR